MSLTKPKLTQEVLLHRDVSVALRSTLRDCANGMPEELVVNSLALNNVPVEITRTVIGVLLSADWIARRDGRLYYVSYDETKDQKL